MSDRWTGRFHAGHAVTRRGPLVMPLLVVGHVERVAASPESLTPHPPSVTLPHGWLGPGLPDRSGYAAGARRSRGQLGSGFCARGER